MVRCPRCQTEYNHIYNFCKKCGAKIEETPLKNYHFYVIKTNIFLFVILLYIGLVYLLKVKYGFYDIMINNFIFSFIVLTFLIIDFKDVKDFLFSEDLNLKFIGYNFLISFILAYLVSHFIIFLKNNFNIIYVESNMIYENHFYYSLIFSIITDAVFPGFFEEIAFRGILYNNLKKIMSESSTILVTSIMFTLLHISFISFLWIFPIGYYLGYLRYKYGHIMYGILFHFAYNTSIVLIDYFDI